MKSALTQARLHELFDYQPDTGHLVRKLPRGDQPAGSIAGYRSKTTGYVKVKVDKRTMLAHRLIWLYVTGAWPKQEVDHRDGVRSNNKWANLREATTPQNRQNLAVRRTNKSGLPGAIRTSDGKRWRSKIRNNGEAIFLGNFETAEEASAAYLRAKARLHTFNPTVRPMAQAIGQ